MRVQSPPVPPIYVIRIADFAAESKLKRSQSDLLKPEDFTAARIAVSSSFVSLTDMPGALALFFGVFGLPTFFIK